MFKNSNYGLNIESSFKYILKNLAFATLNNNVKRLERPGFFPFFIKDIPMYVHIYELYFSLFYYALYILIYTFAFIKLMSFNF